MLLGDGVVLGHLLGCDGGLERERSGVRGRGSTSHVAACGGESSLLRVPQRHRGHSMLRVSPRECRVGQAVALRPTGRRRQQAGAVRQPMEAKPERR